MSAVFGVIYKRGKPVGPETADRIKDALRHRIRDGYAVWREGHVLLGHCREIYLPEDRYENLPLETDDFVITADARIDNREELLQLFHIGKEQAVTMPDTTLILHAYQKWGTTCAEYLDGEFSAAIWHKTEQSLFVVTDHVGFRPVYYYDAADMFVFCTEKCGVMAVKPSPHYFNESSLIDYLCRTGRPEETYTTDVFALCGGNRLLLSRGGDLRIQKYWEPQTTGTYRFKHKSEWFDCLREILFDIIRKQIRSDKRIGITLSGGLDSSSIACILSDVLGGTNREFYAYSSVLPPGHAGPETDEQAYIRIVAEKCPNLVVTPVHTRQEDLLHDITGAFTMEEGFPNIFYHMDYALATKAREDNIGTLFTGFGGDFMVSLQGGFVPYDLIRQGRWIEAGRVIHAFAVKNKKSIRFVLDNYYFAYARWFQWLRDRIKGYDPERLKKAHFEKMRLFLNDAFLLKYQEFLYPPNANTLSGKVIQQIASGRSGKSVSRFMNRHARFGMSSAAPLLHKRISDFMMDLPPEMLLSDGVKRGLLRTAMKGVLPEGIRNRRDKQPYIPAFRSSVVAKLNEMKDVPVALNPELKKYFSETSLSAYVNVIDEREKAELHFSQRFIAIHTLDTLKEMGYVL